MFIRKLLSILLALSVLSGLAGCSDEKGDTDMTTTEDTTIITKTLDVTPLNTVVTDAPVRKRETAQGSRLLVDHDNPLFLFRTCQPAMPDRGKMFVNTYNALPADLREFSAVFATPTGNLSEYSVEELFDAFDEILDVTDANNIPTILQIEYWDSADVREAFTKEQLCDLLERHPSLVGFGHVEQSCSGFVQEEIDRIKTTIRACEEYGALFVWQEMEYQWDRHRNVVNIALEDKELYELMTANAQNIIIQDKHNGRGRHFAVQSSAMGAWLAGVCGNWGTNVEAWLWWEVQNLDYTDTVPAHAGENYYYRYPPALGGIDTICDLVGGANVYSTEELYINVTTMDGIKMTETFWSVIYPLYKRIIDGAVPEREEVVDKIKVAYQFTSFDDSVTRGLESSLFIETYGIKSDWYMKYQGTDSTKKWIPYTGRYYIIPSLPKYADAAKVLPGVDILNAKNYLKTISNVPAKKQAYLNERYPETYTGDATLFSIGGLTYIFNNSEALACAQSATYSLEKTGLSLTASLAEHTYLILEERADGLSAELVNLRLDSVEACTSEGMQTYYFLTDYLAGGKMDLESDRRTTVLTLTGLTAMPEVNLSGINNPTAEVTYDPAADTATITIVSNGSVKLEINK